MCKFCETPNPDTNTECDVCGKPLESGVSDNPKYEIKEIQKPINNLKKESLKMVVCPKCNQLIAEKIKFCNHCGAFISTSSYNEPTAVQKPKEIDESSPIQTEDDDVINWPEPPQKFKEKREKEIEDYSVFEEEREEQPILEEKQEEMQKPSEPKTSKFLFKSGQSTAPKKERIQFNSVVESETPKWISQGKQEFIFPGEKITLGSANQLTSFTPKLHSLTIGTLSNLTSFGRMESERYCIVCGNSLPKGFENKETFKNIEAQDMLIFSIGSQTISNTCVNCGQLITETKQPINLPHTKVPESIGQVAESIGSSINDKVNKIKSYFKEKMKR